jgi:hypothetical protein
MSVRRLPALRRVVLAAAPLFSLAACSDGGTASDPVPDGGTVTVDASASWALLDLDAANPSTTADAGSPAWEIGLFATSVMLNGGAAGPGGVVGYCVCQNAAATGAQVQAMTPASELADFEAVGLSSVPADPAAWTTDALVPVLSGWYAYDQTTHQVSAAPSRVFKLRTAEGAAYAKLRVTGIAGAAREHAGRVTIEYAVQPAKGAAMGAAKTATVDVSGGRVYFDLVRGEVSTSADWDLAFEGWDIRVNGGVSGGGQAGAVPVEDAFAAIVDASDLQASLYRGDAYGGVFDEHRWYRYNLTGTDHQVWPTFDVYLVKSGSTIWKVQITGYYGPNAEPRRISVRYAKVSG